MRILNVSKVPTFQGLIVPERKLRPLHGHSGSQVQETEQDFACFFLLKDLEGCHQM